MEQYKQEFIEFMVDCKALKFGEFTLKSGRKSPFFMNAGAYVTGSQLMKLGESYAKAIHDTYGDDFDVLFGPAYKGIPISVVTAVAYSKLYGKEVRYCSDRKEEKDHGAQVVDLLLFEILESGVRRLAVRLLGQDALAVHLLDKPHRHHARAETGDIGLALVLAQGLLDLLSVIGLADSHADQRVILAALFSYNVHNE